MRSNSGVNGVTIRNIIPVLLCGATILGVTSAQADTRDDVLSGIARCGVVHDDRTWLDCLYGAEQPMRAHLGLPAAPEFQQRLVPTGPVMPVSSMPVSSMPASSVPVSSVPVSSVPASMPAAPAPGVATRPAPRKKPSFWDTLLGNNPPIAVSRMSSYRFDKSGAFIVTLENGQRWHQVDVEGGTAATWLRPASTYKVTVSQGSFGSYMLHTDDNPHVYRVEPAR
jgi:hypothetical protein